MFIAVNRIAAPAAQQQAMIEAFEKSAPAMKQFKGFLGLELWTAEDNTMLAVSRWESKAALEEYTNNALFQQHHGGAGSQPAHRPDQVTYYTGKIIS
ncbi:MAG TPA: antibiotic biosynthesis monooxygenase family protein [Ktedonobacteraceae bacterium]|nr:antibiotic biosynthesis monooxygenase family protein [Ktedonobacteraceae bacterium]